MRNSGQPSRSTYIEGHRGETRRDRERAWLNKLENENRRRAMILSTSITCQCQSTTAWLFTPMPPRSQRSWCYAVRAGHRRRYSSLSDAQSDKRIFQSPYLLTQFSINFRYRKHVNRVTRRLGLISSRSVQNIQS